MLKMLTCWNTPEERGSALRTFTRVAARVLMVPHVPIELTRYDEYMRAAAPGRIDRMLSSVSGLISDGVGQLIQVGYDELEIIEAEDRIQDVVDLVIQPGSGPLAMFGSAHSLQASGRNGLLSLAQNWICNVCANASAGGIVQYNAHHTGCGRYCLHNFLDPLIRGYCGSCFSSGKLNALHKCPGTSTYHPYRRLTPSEGFTQESYTPLFRTPWMVRVTDLLGKVINTFATGPEIVAHVMNLARGIREQEITDGMHTTTLLPDWIRKRSQPGVVKLLAAETLKKILVRSLNYANNGLQDGIVELGDFTYRGVPVRVP